MSFNPNNTIIGSVLITKDLQVDGTTFISDPVITGCVNTNCIKEVTADAFEIKNASGTVIMKANDTSTTIGKAASTGGLHDIAIGESAGFRGNGGDCIAIGERAGYNNGLQNGSEMIAIGTDTLSSFNSSETGANIAIGIGAGNSLESGNTNIFLGQNANVMTSGSNNIAMGNYSTLNNFSNQICIGNSNTTRANLAIAIGKSCDAKGEDSIAIGNTAIAEADSIAFGSGSADTGECVLGGAEITKVRTSGSTALGDSKYQFTDIHLSGNILSNSGLKGQSIVDTSATVSDWIYRPEMLTFYANYNSSLGGATSMNPGHSNSAPGTYPFTALEAMQVVPAAGFVYKIRNFCDTNNSAGLILRVYKDATLHSTINPVPFALVNNWYRYDIDFSESVTNGTTFSVTWEYSSGANPGMILTQIEYCRTANN